MGSELWRDTSPPVRKSFFDWAGEQLETRGELGRERYGDIFQGDPVDQAIEECLDQLFYLWMAKRKQAVTVRPCATNSRDVIDALRQLDVPERHVLAIEEYFGVAPRAVTMDDLGARNRAAKPHG